MSFCRICYRTRKAVVLRDRQKRNPVRFPSSVSHRVQIKNNQTLLPPDQSARISVFMNMIANPIPLAVNSAYTQLNSIERDFVDKYIPEMERRADEAGEPFVVVARNIPADLYAGSRGLLDRPMVQAAIAERIKTISEQSSLTPWRIMKELQNIIFANMVDYTKLHTDAEGNVSRVVDPSDCTPDQWAAVKKWKVEDIARGGRKADFELHDKLNAIGKAMTIMGLTEAGNAYWRDQEAKQNTISTAQSKIDAGSSDQVAADVWNKYIESGRAN